MSQQQPPGGSYQWQWRSSGPQAASCAAEQAGSAAVSCPAVGTHVTELGRPAIAASAEATELVAGVTAATQGAGQSIEEPGRPAIAANAEATEPAAGVTTAIEGAAAEAEVSNLSASPARKHSTEPAQVAVPADPPPAWLFGATEPDQVVEPAEPPPAWFFKAPQQTVSPHEAIMPGSSSASHSDRSSATDAALGAECGLPSSGASGASEMAAEAATAQSPCLQPTNSSPAAGGCLSGPGAEAALCVLTEAASAAVGPGPSGGEPATGALSEEDAAELRPAAEAAPRSAAAAAAWSEGLPDEVRALSLVDRLV